MRLFDRYIAVDWSAANSPTTGPNSIWIAEAHADRRRVEPVNPATRAKAATDLRDRFLEALAAGDRILAGFDFPFGYPAGAANALAGDGDWRALWSWLFEVVDDADDNRSNRFAVANEANAEFDGGVGPFWGNGTKTEYSNLTRKKTRYRYHPIAERRRAEAIARSAQPVWKLAGAGCVGSQAMLGIARLEAMRRDPELGPKLAVWPFETDFDRDLSAPIVLAEIYPSLFDLSPFPDDVKDRAQVRAVVNAFRTADARGALRAMLTRPEGLRPVEEAAILNEEGWIVGVRERPKGAIRPNADYRG